ncbi:MAG: helicase-associated domain-containing protein [Acidobacteria bacterium]|nr:helicase-associated domain-containing protein [Acidobacteriota bacterium]
MWRSDLPPTPADATRPGDTPRSERPLVVQSDGTLLLEVGGAQAEEARNALCAFAQIEKSPEYIHTYRLTALSLWNAASAGVRLPDILGALSRFSRYPVPDLVERNIRDQFDRFGQVVMVPRDEEFLLLRVYDSRIRLELQGAREMREHIQEATPEGFLVPVGRRGAVKQALVRLAYPPEDLCGYMEGVPLSLALRATSRGGAPFGLRRYQQEAVDAFHHGGGPQGGAGVIVLPCGAGKTVIGLGVMSRLRTSTLILCTNTVAVHQWRDELLDKTDLAPNQIGEYTGDRKEIRPITLTTYQILTHRAAREEEFRHLELMRRNQWGLIIYDEVHTLPAPVFRATAEIQVRRRLGLTATLIREDGREGDVFALIGPKKYELPWKFLEQKGYIAEAGCFEIRVALPEALHVPYALGSKRAKYRLAAENPRKIEIVEELIENNPDDAILVIGQYVDQLERIAGDLGFPLITGKTPNARRERLYQEFRQGRQRVLVVSKVANFAIDLPDASMAIEISGAFGSRQEEAQRLGRILRPKARSSRFYAVVSRDTVEQEFGHRRQLFLVEQGYRYRIIDWDA